MKTVLSAKQLMSFKVCYLRMTLSNINYNTIYLKLLFQSALKLGRHKTIFISLVCLDNG